MWAAQILPGPVIQLVNFQVPKNYPTADAAGGKDRAGLRVNQ